MKRALCFLKEVGNVLRIRKAVNSVEFFQFEILNMIYVFLPQRKYGEALADCNEGDFSKTYSFFIIAY